MGVEGHRVGYERLDAATEGRLFDPSRHACEEDYEECKRNVESKLAMLLLRAERRLAMLKDICTRCARVAKDRSHGEQS